MTDARIVPIPDQDSEPYFAALADGRLDLQQCRECGHWTWPPRPICSFCQSDELAWRTANGTGEVHSWVVTHNIYGPGFAELVPYVTVLIRLDEQPDLLVPGRFLSDTELRQGLRVRAVTEKLADGVGEVNWASAG